MQKLRPRDLWKASNRKAKIFGMPVACLNVPKSKDKNDPLWRFAWDPKASDDYMFNFLFSCKENNIEV